MATLVQPGYLLEHDWAQEPERLKLLEDHADSGTIRRLSDAGLRRGWSCLEVGAGRARSRAGYAARSERLVT